MSGPNRAGPAEAEASPCADHRARPAEGEASWADQPSSARRSRRQVLAGGGTAMLGMAALLAGCGEKLPPVSNLTLSSRTPGAAEDVRIFNGLLATEYHAVAAYTAVVPLLPQPPKPQPNPTALPTGPAPPPYVNSKLIPVVPLSAASATQVLAMETSHAGELSGIIVQLGGTPVKPEASYDLGHPKTKEELLHLLLSVERTQIRAYLKALGTLSVGSLRAAAAAIFASEAQQIAVLRFELGMSPIPSAFVTEHQ